MATTKGSSGRPVLLGSCALEGKEKAVPQFRSEFAKRVVEDMEGSAVPAEVSRAREGVVACKRMRPGQAQITRDLFGRLMVPQPDAAAAAAAATATVTAAADADAAGAGEGKQVHRFTLTNARMSVQLTDYGARVLSIVVPDRQGNAEEVTLQGNTWEEVWQFAREGRYYGCVCGRVCNRIAGGQFSLPGQEGEPYRLAANNGPNHLHGGGHRSFDKVVWDAQLVGSSTTVGVRFTYTSPAGEEGYPGKLRAAVTYELDDAQQLSIRYEATCDQTTLCNLTNHTYFNLSGNLREPTQSHFCQLHCDRVLPVDETSIPTGEIRAVEGTPFDLRASSAHPFGKRMEEAMQAMDNGFDHCFVVSDDSAEEQQKQSAGGDEKEGVAKEAERAEEKEEEQEAEEEEDTAEKDQDRHEDQNRGISRQFPGCKPVADIRHRGSGRRMQLFATTPCVQLYTGNFLPGPFPHTKHNAFCLETQDYVDAVNHAADFPAAKTVLAPGEQYEHQAVFRFSTF